MNTPIEITSGALRALLLPTGATLNRFQIGSRDLILGFRDPADYQRISVYAGAIVGPVANRITGGALRIAGQPFQMERNENKANALHSGSTGLHNRHWDVIEHSRTHVAFQCHLTDGEGGLPGRRQITATYRIDDEGLTVEVLACSDTATPFNIAHHPYWVLDADQSQTRLLINADRYLPTDAAGLPTGEIAQVSGTPFDFTTLRPIGTGAALDHNYCCANARGTTLHPMAQLRSQDGLTLHVQSSEPGLQVYAGSGLPDVQANRTFGHKMGPHAGIALEPQGWPDAPNNPQFPDIITPAGTTYRQRTRYKIIS